MESTLRAKLKGSTQAAHTQIESNPVLAKLTRPGLSVSDYRAILRSYYGFFVALENQFLRDGASRLIVDFSQRLRAPRLAHDLKGLGMSDADIKASPRAALLPSTASSSALLGVMYVMEGSTLGGMIIAKGLQAYDFFTPETGSFFLADPQATSLRWKSFIEVLENTPGLDEAAVVSSASQTFRSLDAWMSGALVRN